MTKYFLNIIFCLAFINPSYAQKITFKTGKPTSKTYYTEIPYKNIKGKLIIPVTINNTNYNFLFDTGAPNLISSALMKEIKSNNSKSISVSDANQNKQRMELISIPLLTLGNVSFKNTSALVFNGTDNLVFDCYDIDGIIGSNILRKSIVQIQSEKNLIILTNDLNKVRLEKQTGMDLVLRSNQSSPYITIKIKDKKNAKENVLIDTGASGFYDMCKSNYKALEEYNILSNSTRGEGTSSIGLFGASEAETQYLVKIPEIEIDGHTFTNISTITTSDDNSRIGADILEHGIMTLDFKHKRFHFDAYKAKSDLTEKNFGFTPTIQDNNLIVGIVWNENLKDKIHVGDKILKINDMDLLSMDICDLLTEDSPFKSSNIIHITIKNKSGETSSFILEKH
ncbi:aspartyl protease family protein [Aestuariivivens sp. NBU2969]|uniref:aspartyl protease family protein n=1 Tax=Aestuariivivens sp. NBU2969 TaxID=2873267 RepID=UPI001CC15BD2|nr:aspartyl protease family protein [Aestuariivivens sp. NBU2969]